jgi:hypothetical protein
MICKLPGAFGLALLAATFVCGGSVSYAQTAETEAAALAAVAPDSNTAGERNLLICGIDRSDAVSCKGEAEFDALPSAAPEVDHAPTAISDAEPLATESAPPGVTLYDAVVLDIVATVTIAVPGFRPPDEGPLFVGPVPLEEAITPPDWSFDEPTVGDGAAAAYDYLE